MLNLYNYLRESLLDDEDDLMHDSDVAITSHELSQVPNKYFGIDNGGNHFAAIKNNNLYINSGTVVLYPEFDKLSEYVDTVYAYGLNLNQYIKKGDLSNFKTINCVGMYNNMFASNIEIKNVNINILASRHARELLDKETEPLGRHFKTSTIGGVVKYFCNTLKFDNANINFDKDSSQRQIECSVQTFPDFSGLKTNTYILKMRSPEILKKPEVVKYLDKVFDCIGKTIKVGEDMQTVGNTREEILIKNFKNIYAIVNNPKKYGILSSRFQINPNISLKDVFPWIKNMPELRVISISDNNILVRFLNKNVNDFIYGEDDVFSKDGWEVEVIKFINC